MTVPKATYLYFCQWRLAGVWRLEQRLQGLGWQGYVTKYVTECFDACTGRSSNT